MTFEKREIGYVFFSGLPLAVRGVVLIGLVGAGFVLQIVYGHLWIGLGVLLAAAALGAHRSITPSITLSSRKNADWETVTVGEWNRFDQITAQQKRWRRDLTNITSGGGWLIGLIGLICFGMFFFYIDVDEGLALIFIADLVVLFSPVFFSGMIQGWEPPGLALKLDALKNVYRALEGRARNVLELRPMLQLANATDRDASGSAPIDAKLMIRFQGQPESFYGVQVQCTLNKVGSTSYPYLYAVVLTAPDFPIDKRNPPRPHGRELVFEPSQSAEAVVLVVRQKTTKTSGYHTDERRQVEIVEAAIDLAQRILAGERAA